MHATEIKIKVKGMWVIIFLFFQNNEPVPLNITFESDHAYPIFHIRIYLLIDFKHKNQMKYNLIGMSDPNMMFKGPGLSCTKIDFLFVCEIWRENSF